LVQIKFSSIIGQKTT